MAVGRASMQRKMPSIVEHICSVVSACLAVAMVTANEQSLIYDGTYVRLHGLNKQQYNGQEGMVVRCENEKAEVRLADSNQGCSSLIKVHRKNLTVLPTYTVSRCKLRQHETVEVTLEPEPVTGWPTVLTGSYFDYLGVDRTATTDQIKIAYRNLSKLLHPDKNPLRVDKATALFKQIREAYDILKDDSGRVAYLRRLRVQEAQQQQGLNPFNGFGWRNTSPFGFPNPWPR